jgi:hypothetical protein
MLLAATPIREFPAGSEAGERTLSGENLVGDRLQLHESSELAKCRFGR